MFLTGHAGRGVVPFLDGRANFATLLRRPVDQAVSSYLHVLSDRDNPLHELARRRSLAGYLRECRNFICQQTEALYIALGLGDGLPDLAHQDTVAPILRFMDQITFVGVTNLPRVSCRVLSAVLKAPIVLPTLNTADSRGISQATVRRLRDEYFGLWREGSLRRLFDIEWNTYAQARSRLRRSLAGLERTCAGGDVARFRRFFGPDAFDIAGAEALLDPPAPSLIAKSFHIISGPNVRLGSGVHDASFHIDARGVAADDPGRVQIEVLANPSASLRRRWIRLSALTSPGSTTLRFANLDNSNVLQFRVRSQGCRAGALDFGGVTVLRAAAKSTWPALLARAARLVEAVRGRRPKPENVRRR